MLNSSKKLKTQSRPHMQALVLALPKLNQSIGESWTSPVRVILTAKGSTRDKSQAAVNKQFTELHRNLQLLNPQKVFDCLT